MDCRFCHSLEEDEVFESTYWRVIINLNQNRLGNILIVLNRHATDIIDLSNDEVIDLWDVIKHVKTALDTCFSPSHINYAFQMNRSKHVHMHLSPRYNTNPTFEDIVFIDDDTITHRRMPPSVHARIRGKIRNALET